MNIAVLMGGLLYDSQKSLLKGITDCAKKEGINVFVFTCGGDIYAKNAHSRGEFQIYHLPELSFYDGIIVAPNTIQNAEVVEELKRKLAQVKSPTIAIDGGMENMRNFKVDNAAAMYRMTEHVVLKHNRRSILYISGPEKNVESNSRKEGFLQCMADCGMQADKDYRIVYGDFWMDSGRKIMRDCLGIKKYFPEAVICANDYMAIGAAEELKERGIAIPDRVLVTGFDNSYEARYHAPRISSVEKPMYAMGKAACRELLEGILSKETRRFRVSYKFSESCGCHLPEKDDMADFKRQMTREKSSNIRWAEIISAMSANLNELATLEEFIEKLKQYIKKMDFPCFYLCLCEEKQLIGKLEKEDGVYRMPCQDKSEYSEEMQVVIAYEKGKFYPSQGVHTKKLLPEQFYKQEKGAVFVVVPIHFRLHNMGYCIVGNSSFPMETIQFQAWITNIGNGLENIRKQMLMQSMIQQLNKMWIYDTMTGSLNRAGFYIKAKEIVEYCRKNRKQMLLLFLDIDGLKAVNDALGHEEGDFYIKSVAKIVKEHAGGGIVMRYGGDEFVVLRCLGEDTDCRDLIHGIEEAVRVSGEKEGKPYRMSVSIGHYIAEAEKSFHLELLLEQADREMYRRKRSKNSADKEREVLKNDK